MAAVYEKGELKEVYMKTEIISITYVDKCMLEVEIQVNIIIYIWFVTLV